MSSQRVFKPVSEEFFMFLLLYLFHNHITNFLVIKCTLRMAQGAIVINVSEAYNEALYM